jgi:hypothetical protein
MSTVMVRYRIKAGEVAQNEALIAAVFKELDWDKPAGLQYKVFKMADGLSFMHVAIVDDTRIVHPLLQLPAFKEFIADVRDRCDEQPVTTQMTMLGSYADPYSRGPVRGI